MLTIGDLEAADAQGRATAVQEAAGAKDPRRLNEAWRKGQGVALRWLREAAGLTQQDIAEVVGVNAAAVVSEWERGKNMVPLDKMRLLASHYGLPVGRFVVVGLPTVGETRDPVAASDPWATGITSPPAPGADSTSGVVSAVESNGAPGRKVATRGYDGEPAPAVENPCASSPACRVRAIPEVP